MVTSGGALVLGFLAVSGGRFAGKLCLGEGLGLVTVDEGVGDLMSSLCSVQWLHHSYHPIKL